MNGLKPLQKQIMKKMVGGKKFGLCLLLACVCHPCISVADEDIAIYATACEQVKNEAISSVRTRAADKALFTAVKKLPELAEVKNSLSDHDFNVLVYAIADNQLQNVNMITQKQDDFEICVEVNADLPKENLNKELLQNKNKESALEKAAETMENITEEQPKTIEDIIEKNSTPQIKDETKALVFLDKLTFYNNTSSQAYTNALAKHLQNNFFFYMSDDREVADYIIIPKVLKAKVENINENTKRLHMIVSVDLQNEKEDLNITEHQNKIILFNSDDDPQKIASGLMTDLLNKAFNVVVKKIETTENKKLKNLIIPVKN